MRLQRQFLYLIICSFLWVCLFSQNACARLLTTQEIDRVRAVKKLLYEVDTKSLKRTIQDLESTRHPQTGLDMMEAMANTYIELVRDYRPEGQKKKRWLYSMVCLNMAYLQFGGSKGKVGSTTELNRLIRQELLKYLPSNILTQPGFLYSLE